MPKLVKYFLINEILYMQNEMYYMRKLILKIRKSGQAMKLNSCVGVYASALYARNFAKVKSNLLYDVYDACYNLSQKLLDYSDKIKTSLLWIDRL